jgi:moderate conductance mechanosensitive channel
VDEVIEVIKEVDEELRTDPAFSNDILEPIEILGLDQFADSAIIIKARTKTKPIRQWTVGREFNKRLKKIRRKEHGNFFSTPNPLRWKG